MDDPSSTRLPSQCPSCSGDLEITELRCRECSTEIRGHFAPTRLVNLPEPYASVLEMFLRVRGNVKDMERELGLSYPTVRSRLEEAFVAAGLGSEARESEVELRSQRLDIIGALERGEIPAAEAIEKVRQMRKIRR